MTRLCDRREGAEHLGWTTTVMDVGVGRWWLRVEAYAFLLVTDSYPPFSLT